MAISDSLTYLSLMARVLRESMELRIEVGVDAVEESMHPILNYSPEYQNR